MNSHYLTPLFRIISLAKNFIYYLLLALTFIALLPSCKTPQKVKLEDTTNLDFKSARVLKDNLKKNEFKYEWLSAKFSVDATIDSNKNTVAVIMRARKDSVIWMLVSVPIIGAEAARIMITKDSVKFLNKFKNTYFAGDFNYLSKLLHTDLDFEMIQSLLMGNSAAFYEEEEKLKSGIDNRQYLLSTIRKRRLKKVMEGNREHRDPIQSIWLKPAIYKISHIFISEFNPVRTFDARYDNFQPIDSLLFPNKVNFDIKAEKNVSISIEYSKITLNKPQTFPFNIPEQYERIIYKEN